MVSSTLALVFFSTIVFGALMPALIKLFKSFDKDNSNSDHNYVSMGSFSSDVKFDYLHPNFSSE